jgi:hypothetical protein
LILFFQGSARALGEGDAARPRPQDKSPVSHFPSTLEEPAASEGLKVVEKSISKTCPAVMSKSFYNDSAVNDSVLIL